MSRKSIAAQQRAGSDTPMTPEVRKTLLILDSIAQRLDGCSGLFGRAKAEIRDKRDRAENPPDYIDPDEAAKLEDSSKLGRAIDDMRAVRANLNEIIKALQAVTGDREAP